MSDAKPDIPDLLAEVKRLRAAFAYIKAQPAGWVDSDELDTFIDATLAASLLPPHLLE